MKSDSNFRMAKTTKKLLATFKDKTARNLFKDMMISAQISHAAAKKKALSSKKESKESDNS